MQWQRVHMVGIKGVGMTALAQILVSKGIHVTGSDTAEHFFTDEVLVSEHISVAQGFKGANIPFATDVVIFSTAYSLDHPELQEARARKIPVVSYPQALGMLLAHKEGIAVAGSHGKTTTTAMLGLVFRDAGFNPTVVVGSTVPQLGGNAISGKGPHVILEADEYQNKFQYYNSKALIVTAIDWDHPDYFPTSQAYQNVFEDFIARIPHNGVVVGCGDDSHVNKALLVSHAPVMKYGWYAAEKGLGLTSYEYKKGKQYFTAVLKGKEVGKFSLAILGKHNVLNSLAVIGMSLHYDVPVKSLQTTLANFQSTKRRMEYKGERDGVKVYDDYAHTPAEIKATLAGLRQMYPSQHIIAVFQPHTYSRTKAFLSEFAQAFSDVNEVILLPIYASARENAGGVTSEDLARETKKYHPHVSYAPSSSRLSLYGRGPAKGGGEGALPTILITLGAGDVWKVGEELLKQERNGKK